MIKIVIVGDSGVGKTSLLRRYVDNEFDEKPHCTIGADFKEKTIQLERPNCEGKEVKLQIWDTNGQERFRTITASYYGGARAILLVYDITDPGSLRELQNYLKEVERYACKSQKIIVGNKIDLRHERRVTEAEIAEFGAEAGIKVYEASAKDPDGDNLAKIFQDLVTLVIEKGEEESS